MKQKYNVYHSPGGGVQNVVPNSSHDSTVGNSGYWKFIGTTELDVQPPEKEVVVRETVDCMQESTTSKHVSWVIPKNAYDVEIVYKQKVPA